MKYGTSKPATIGGKYPYLRMNNITYEGQLDLTDLKFIDIPDKEIEKCVVRKGDVLFNRTNSKELVGKTCVFNIDTPMVIAGYIIRVKVNEKVIPEYLSTFLNLKYSKNILFEMCKAAIGQANINAQELQDIEIIIPPMSLQLKFLDLLHQTDKSKFVCYSNFKSQFIEMFGDPLENPFGWEQVTLKDISKGKLSYGSGASATTYDGKTRYVRITDITDSGELNDDIKSPSIYEAIHALNEGDILFARSGATVGKTYCHNEKYGKCIYAGYLIRLIPDKEKVLPEYVFHYTKTDYYNNFVAINKRTVAQPNINAKQYGDLVICVPPLEIQNRFVELIHQTDKSKLSEHVTYNSLGDMLVNLNLFRR
ncbi:restriction endonuclease subunit S [Schinkia azotoformans]|uniref:restriction endonuclease subunit S n=7 Tax=Schinkia azotoformans TaxID=1454 RepID=UPI002E1C1DD4|nr:restriction endonuclease subunit S [Schinkia azotoformans]MED4367026.1 restriction endonuclease subunit S [Schinkia azotoformans]